MDEAGTCISFHQCLNAPFDFLVIGGSESLHHDTHRPNHVIAHMRTADTLTGLALEEIRVAAAPDELPGILPDRVINGHVTEIWECKKARHIGIIHKEPVAHAIHFERINLTELRMFHDCIFLDGGFHLISKSAAFLGSLIVFVHGLQNLGSLAQRRDSEEVGRNQEVKCSGIVRRSERRNDQADRLHRIAIAHAAFGIKLTLGLTHETI